MPDNENYTPSTPQSITDTGGIPNVQLTVSGNGAVQTPVDTTLTIEGMAADAKAVGDSVNGLQNQVDIINDELESDFVRLSQQTLTEAQAAQVRENIDVVNAIYPVGSVFICASEVNPNDQFPGTTWQPIEGRFLVASSSGRSAGTTGGADTASFTPSGTVGSTTLTAAQSGLPAHTHNHSLMLPEHTHGFTRPTVSATIKTRTLNVNVSSAMSSTVHSPDASGSNVMDDVITMEYNPTGRVLESTTASCTGSISAVTAQNAEQGHSHSFTGTPVSVSILPPYLAVNMWRRTA